MSVAINGLTAEQCAAFTGIRVGDLILIEKISSTPDEDNQDDEDSDESFDSEAGADDETAAADEAGANDDIGADEDADDDEVEEFDDADEEAGDDSETSNVQASGSTASTEIVVPSRMYVVSAISKNSQGAIVEVLVAHLTYSPKFVPDCHTYKIYGKSCEHDHPLTCSKTGCSNESPLSEVLQGGNFKLTVKPDGDVVKRVDQAVACFTNGKCIPGCHNGYLATHEMLQDMIKGYSPPTLSFQGQDLTTIMPSVCPVCHGCQAVKTQQALQANLLLGAPPDLGRVVDFIGSLDSRRRRLGYRFRQLDEREWNTFFDDMLSEDGDDNGGRWQQWAEANDPNGSFKLHPASEATIASLPRKNAKDVPLGEEPKCKVCLDTIEVDQVVVELPCHHVDHHEECISTWLKHNKSCPTCRREVAAASEEDTNVQAQEEMAVAVGEGQVEGIHTMEGEDTVSANL